MNSNTKKIFIISLLTIAIITTIGLCVKKPAMHKPLSIDYIDYLIKFNDDGSVTTTKQTTTTIIKENN